MNVTRFSDRHRVPSRRDFLKLATSVVLGLTGGLSLAGVFRFLAFESDEGIRSDFDVGASSDYPLNSPVVRPEIPAVIARNDAGFTALSLICSHLGCTVEEAPEGFACPCHGSRYDSQGRVTRGPASQSLRRLGTQVRADGHLIVRFGEG